MDASMVLPILLYHRIAASSDDRYAVSPGAFSEHLDAIVASGRKALTVSQIAEILKGHGGGAGRYLAVTFDDGYAETLEAVHTLTAAGLGATVYVTTDFIGAAGMLTAEQIKTLGDAGEGVEVGAHTASHPHLDELRRGQAEVEIAGSRAALLALGVTARTFAYPHGAYDAAVRSAVIRAGFTSAAAVKNALSHLHDDPYAIARWTVTSTTSAEHVARLLEGLGAPLAWRRERWRTRGYRVVRRSRRRAHELFGPRANPT